MCVELADKAGACIAIIFGRANTPLWGLRQVVQDRIPAAGRQNSNLCVRNALSVVGRVERGASEVLWAYCTAI